MDRRTKEELGVTLAGLVALHEHHKTLRQERVLAGKERITDTGSWRFITWVMVGLLVYAAGVLVVAVVEAAWPWLLAVALAVVGALVARRVRRRRRAAP